MASVFEALQLGPKCNDSAPHSAPSPRRAVGPESARPGANATAYWVSPSGSDKAAGSEAAPWRTLPHVLAVLAATPAASRPPTTVNLLPGTYTLNDTLQLSAVHSGASAGAPIVFRATAAGSVTLSGGEVLSGLSWARVGGGSKAWSAKLPSRGATWRFDSLFAGAQRQWRARWPNGNPETYCARDLRVPCPPAPSPPLSAHTRAACCARVRLPLHARESRMRAWRRVVAAQARRAVQGVRATRQDRGSCAQRRRHEGAPEREHLCEGERRPHRAGIAASPRRDP